MCISLYIYIYIYMCVYIYIYIYRQFYFVAVPEAAQAAPRPPAAGSARPALGNLLGV